MSDKTEHPPLPGKFASLGIRNSILRALADLKFTEPSEIQSLLIPRALAGVDILGQARTGTGKTAAFAIPVLQRAQRGIAAQALILVPTRELCVQVNEEIRRIGQYTPIRSVAVYGGEKIAAQVRSLKHHPEIVVGTPGRVMDLLDRRLLSLANIRFIVLDEVDRMLDIGFREDIRNILSRISTVASRLREDPAAEPSTGNASGQPNPEAAPSQPPQTIFVSATITEEIERLARRFMREPVEKIVAPGADEKPTVEKVEQVYYAVQPWDKYRLLRMILEKEKPELAIIFCRTKHGADKLAKHLKADGVACREIHGNLQQNKREKVMKSFRTGRFDVLVATDLASRGIDVADISHIINYDIPEDPEVYVHRIGRTARMGATGKAITLVTREQAEQLTRIENLINMVLEPARMEGFEPSPPPQKPPETQVIPALIGPSPAAQAQQRKAGMRLGARLPVTRRRR
ncbi:MAG: DEAD/DEAH box helicase [Phycisphaerae bacterium]|nr:DEAD/DEAH box helicase [Phycisphaerae bacterium]MDW8261182.1 DEAD/DEAH box helicase [Phycisphaerales bacterium]